MFKNAICPVCGNQAALTCNACGLQAIQWSTSAGPLRVLEAAAARLVGDAAAALQREIDALYYVLAVRAWLMVQLGRATGALRARRGTIVPAPPAGELEKLLIAFGGPTGDPLLRLPLTELEPSRAKSAIEAYAELARRARAEGVDMSPEPPPMLPDGLTTDAPSAPRPAPVLAPERAPAAAARTWLDRDVQGPPAAQRAPEVPATLEIAPTRAQSVERLAELLESRGITPDMLLEKLTMPAAGG